MTWQMENRNFSDFPGNNKTDIIGKWPMNEQRGPQKSVNVDLCWPKKKVGQNKSRRLVFGQKDYQSKWPKSSECEKIKCSRVRAMLEVLKMILVLLVVNDNHNDDHNDYDNKVTNDVNNH